MKLIPIPLKVARLYLSEKPPPLAPTPRLIPIVGDPREFLKPRS